jgi:arabinofuranan 3-O-arabinosyltransferase
VIVAVHSAATPPAGGILLSAGIETVSIPGVSLEQRILLPNDESKVFSKGTSNGSVVAFSRSLTNENLTLGVFSTDDPDMRREFILPKKESVTAVGTAIPQPGTGVDNLISFFSPVPTKATYTVTASSSLGSLPKFSPQNLVETDSKAPWIANIGDQQPWINVQWAFRRAVSSVKLAPTGTASTPTQVAITPLGGPTVVRSVPAKGGVLTFPETLTDSLKIQILRSEGHLSVTPSLGVGVPLPVGLSAISIPGLLTSAYRYHGPNLNERFRLTCGDGPRITLDGKSYDTSIAGTVGDLVNLRPVAVTLCTPNDGLALESGVHNFASSDGEFLMTSFVMQPEHPVSAANITKRSASLVDWAAESRKVHVGAGPATYIVLPQNFSAGWVARFGDQELKSVRIDGWEQGFVVPGGKAGTVTMDMQPNGIYEVLLIIGGLLLLALIVLALFPARRKPPYPEVGSAKPSFWLLLGLSAVALLLVAGPWALALVPLLAFARHWGRIPMAAAAFFAFIVAGVISAIHPATLNAKTAAAFTAPVQLASVAALAAVLTALVADNWPQGASVEEGHAALATGVGDEVTSNLSSEAVDESGGSE